MLCELRYDNNQKMTSFSSWKNQIKIIYLIKIIK